MGNLDEVKLEVAISSDAALLANLVELYLHDLSEAFPIEVGPEGRFGYPGLSLYWSDPEHCFPFLIKHGQRIVGFVLVTRGSPMSEDPSVFDIAEFFVVRRHRRESVGKRAAFLLWDHLPGRWIVRVSEANTGAIGFWTALITEYAAGKAAQFSRPGSPSAWRVFSFDSRQSSTD